MAKVKLKKLRRDSKEFTVHPEIWSIGLLLAGDNAWRPSIPGYWFLASGLDVSAVDAEGLVAAWDRLIFQAESYIVRRKIVTPTGEVHEVTMELGVLADIRNFCAGGAFRIEGPEE